ncbi:MAG TPA: VOC family protein [Sphingomicrobium sp.]|nr:VOC family protein [Sphingomicrobium sp.]
MARINYVELPATDIAACREFYANAFDWIFADFGPTYSATLGGAGGGDVDLGLQGDAAEAPKALLPVIEVDDLEAALEAVSAAGGQITRPIFSFPGGRRFEFSDPSGNVVAVAHTGGN